MAPPKLAHGSFVGLGFESTSAYGTPVARTAFARIIDANVERANGENIQGTSRGLANDEAYLGPYGVDFSARMEARPETIGAWLRAHAGLGSVATSTPDAGGAPTARLHEVVPTDTRQPVTFERKLGTIPTAEICQGGVVHELGFEFANTLLMMNAGGVAQKEVLGAPSTPTYDTRIPWLRHQAVLAVGGTTLGVKSGRVTLSRFVERDDYETGSRYRVDAEVGEIMAKLEFDLLVRDLDQLRRSLGGIAVTGPQDDSAYYDIDLTFTGALIAASQNYKLALKFPRTFWDPISVNTRERNPMTQRISMTCLRDESTGLAWRARLTNTQTAL